MAYTQNNEEAFILSYFEGQTGNLCDIGANDGVTYSNSRALIERGWSAVLVEPDKRAYKKLSALYAGQSDVVPVWGGIGDETGIKPFHMAAEHIIGDVGLLSTFSKQEQKRWPGISYKEDKVFMMTWQDLKERFNVDFDFISIDAEGMDLEILLQIDLTNVSLVCVEWNGDQGTNKDIDLYCKINKMQRMLQTPENLIYGK